MGRPVTVTRYRYAVAREYVGMVEVDEDDGPFEDEDDRKDYAQSLALDDIGAGFCLDVTIIDVDLDRIEQEGDEGNG